MPSRIAKDPAPLIRCGGYAWVAVGVFIFAWDLLAPESMSSAFLRARRSGRIGDVAVMGAWGVITLHLFGLLPARTDPLNLIGACRRGLHAVPSCIR